jgi:hypothetical protein
VEIGISNSSNHNYVRSSIYDDLVKQELESMKKLTFCNGVVIGVLFSLSLATVLVDEFFVSKDVFNLKTIYVNGRIYKLIEDR